jgi:hypothetical protein
MKRNYVKRNLNLNFTGKCWQNPPYDIIRMIIERIQGGYDLIRFMKVYEGTHTFGDLSKLLDLYKCWYFIYLLSGTIIFEYWPLVKLSKSFLTNIDENRAMSYISKASHLISRINTLGIKIEIINSMITSNRPILCSIFTETTDTLINQLENSKIRILKLPIDSILQIRKLSNVISKTLIFRLDIFSMGMEYKSDLSSMQPIFQCSNLKILTIAGVDVQGCISLFKAMQNSKYNNLIEFGLSDAKFDSDACYLLGVCTRSPASIKKLTLVHCRLTISLISLMITSGLQDSTLLEMDLSLNYFSKDEMKYIAEQLKSTHISFERLSETS